MPYTFELIARRDDYGSVGWVLEGLPDEATAGDGSLVAHDLAEHFPGLDLDTDGEALALGAVLYGRHARGDVTTEGLASDVATLWSDAYEWGDITAREPVTLDDEHRHVEEAADAVMERAYHILVAEHRADGDIGVPPLTWYAHTKAWLLAGWRMAHERYGSPDTMLCVFDEIERQVAPTMKHLEGGEYLVVSMCTETGYVNVDCIERFDERHPDYEPFEDDEDDEEDED